ncbi:VacB/RNase II family 3'-5' exoribonuclease [Candidatus Kaiserbacteria bacterium]|nr:MAG: VacB/RNase II family 3'-5' exoribonuclease [Candidatus Kaiserbacteria bacterium]
MGIDRILRKKESLENIKNPTGFVSIDHNGRGFATIPNIAEQIRIKPENLGTAFSGDEVVIRVLPKKRGQQREAVVMGVKKRKQAEFVGAIQERNGSNIRISTRRINREHPPFEIVDGLHPNVKKGDQVILELIEWNDPKQRPKVRFKRTAGKEGDFDSEAAVIAIEHGFPDRFPTEVLKEAKQISEHSKRMMTPEGEIILDEGEEREDFRDRLTFTIDPKSAKDFDDAISFKDLKNGTYEIGVHIADPTHYIQPDSAIDKEARKRGTTVYLPDRTIPMLPEEISNELCSLNPDEEKRAFSIIFVMDKNGIVKEKKTQVMKTIIKSDKRFTYKGAQDLINNKNTFGGQIKSFLAGTKSTDPLENALKTVWELTAKHRENRTGQGVDESRDRNESKINFDRQGRPQSISKEEKYNTMKMIEELMVLSNNATPEIISKSIANKKKDSPTNFSIYRVQQEPDPEKVAEFDTYLTDLGFPPARKKHWLTRKPQDVTQKDFDEVLINIEGTQQEDFVRREMFGIMYRAMYSSENIGHFALAMTIYAHFTSPIRRYSDFILHRILSLHTISGSEPLTQREAQEYIDLTVKLTHQTIAANNAERDSAKLMQLKIIEDDRNDRRKGKVANIFDYGVFVMDKSTTAYGLIPARNLNKDGWIFKDSPRRFENKTTGEELKVGRNVKVKASNVDFAKRRVEWDLVASSDSKEGSKLLEKPTAAKAETKINETKNKERVNKIHKSFNLDAFPEKIRKDREHVRKITLVSGILNAIQKMNNLSRWPNDFQYKTTGSISLIAKHKKEGMPPTIKSIPFPKNPEEFLVALEKFLAGK